MSAAAGRRKKQKRAANGHDEGHDDAQVTSQVVPAQVVPAIEDQPSEDPATSDAAAPEVESGAGLIDAARLEPEATEADAVAEPEADTQASAAVADATEAATELDRARQRAVLESLIFVSERPVTPAQLARAMKVRVAVIRELIPELMQEYQTRGIELIEVASGYQFRSAAACAPYVREFVAQKPVRLTRAQLETLALISYRQPITRPEIDEVRGVDSGSAIRVLLERNLIKMLGRKDEPGRPLLYGTSSHFLEFFGMRSLKDLPTLREFTELSDENRALFKSKTGESVEDAEAALLAAEDAAVSSADEHISDEDLAELAAQADAEGEADAEAAAPGRDASDAAPGSDASAAAVDADGDDEDDADDDADDDEDDDDEDDEDLDDDEVEDSDAADPP